MTAAQLGPLDHVARPPLPWREAVITECGLPAAGHPVISRDEFVNRVRKLGKTRAMMVTCVTCWNTATRWCTWETDPVQRLMRETYGASRYATGGDRQALFRAELRAIAELVARHRAEFDGIMAALDEAPRLDERRAARRRRPA